MDTVCYQYLTEQAGKYFNPTNILKHTHTNSTQIESCKLTYSFTIWIVTGATQILWWLYPGCYDYNAHTTAHIQQRSFSTRCREDVSKPPRPKYESSTIHHGKFVSLTTFQSTWEKKLNEGNVSPLKSVTWPIPTRFQGDVEWVV